MINYATILSDFDDRGTLLKWLKKVEEALQAAGLDNVTVNVVDSTHITLSFDFADGSSVTSSVIELPEGPQGPEGPPGSDATPVYANILIPPLAPMLSTLSVNGTGYSVFTGDSWALTASGATPGQVLQPDAFGAVNWDKLDADFLTTYNAAAGQVLTADGSNGVAWSTPAAISTGEETVNLVDSSYANVGTAKCRWLKVGDTATVTVDTVGIISSSFYAVELPAAVQGFSNTKQHGVFMGATTGSAKYMECETDTAAPDTGKYIKFIDANGFNYTMPAFTNGVLNITLKY